MRNKYLKEFEKTIANIKKNKEKEVNKMNIWEKMRRKKGLTRVEVAKKMGISEEKVKEVENNMREMPTKEVNNYIKNIFEVSNAEREIELAKAKEWYEKADFKKLLKEFGFKTQGELARKLEVDSSSISCWFAKKTGSRHIGQNSLLKLYYFFNDEFNKVTTKSAPKQESKKVKVTNRAVDRKTAIKWWRDFDLKKAIATMGVKNQKDFANKYNFPQSAVSDWSNKKTTPQYENLTRLYNIFNEPKEEPTSIAGLISTHENVTILESTEPMLNFSTLSQEEMGQKETTFKPSDFSDLVYNNYYQYIPEEPICVKEPTSDLKEDTTKDLILENRELKQRIARYEALIDIIISKNNEN